MNWGPNRLTVEGTGTMVYADSSNWAKQPDIDACMAFFCSYSYWMA